MTGYSRTLLCAFTLMLVADYAAAQSPPAKDFQQWTSVAASWQIAPKLTLHAFGELHTGNDVSQFDQQLLSGGSTYSPSHWVSVGASYLYLHANPALSGLNYENRIYFEITFNTPEFYHFRLSNRVRPELRWLQATHVATFTQRYRNRVTLERAIKNYSPFVMWEEFYNTNVDAWSRVRYYAGVTAATHEWASIQFYFLRENDQHSPPFHKNIVGVSLMLHFGGTRVNHSHE